jgi:hypothetical protein
MDKTHHKNADGKRDIRPKHEKGMGLIVVILVLAFMLTVGILLVTITSTGSKVTGNIRWQEQAFNAAEAGFDSAYLAIEDFFAGASWTSFDGHYLVDPVGIDIPLDDMYFRKKTDAEVLALLDPTNDGNPDYDNVIFYKTPYIPDGAGGYDNQYTYTVFLIDDERGGGFPDPGDALMICIGAVQLGDTLITARVEVELVIELPGT